MRRIIYSGLMILAASLLAGCTGTGLFLDHTFRNFGSVPNAPAGNSQTMQRIRGESIDIKPILPEPGNVWPGPQPPDPTLDEMSKQQAAASRRGLVPPPANPGRMRMPGIAPGGAGPLSSPVVQTPNGPSVTVGGGSERGYKQLQSPTPGGSGILVPNGNGTSTLINPDGSVQTVPTRP